MAEEFAETGDGFESFSDTAVDDYDMDDDDEAVSGDTEAGRQDLGQNQELSRLQEENRRLAERVRMVDQFEQNPEAVMRDIASRMGMDLVPRQGSQTQDNNRPPREFEDNLSKNLPPEMQFMAGSLAPAVWTAIQESMKPFVERQTQERARASTQERDAIVADMDTRYPQWRDHLPEMESLYDWIKGVAAGGSARHPKYGSLQETLFRLVTGDGQATATAANRMRRSAQQGTSLSDTSRESTPSVEALIGKAKTRDERFKIAFQAALRENGVGRG